MRVSSRIRKLIAPALFKSAGVDIFGYWRWLKTSEGWAPQQRAAWRLQRLGDMIEHCWNNVPFYKEVWSAHGVKIRRPRALEELEAFPIINRDVFKENSQRIRAANISSIPHKNESTGGTTGQPLRYTQ